MNNAGSISMFNFGSKNLDIFEVVMIGNLRQVEKKHKILINMDYVVIKISRT